MLVTLWVLKTAGHCNVDYVHFSGIVIVIRRWAFLWLNLDDDDDEEDTESEHL